MIGFALAMTAAIVCSVLGDFFVKQGTGTMRGIDLDVIGGPGQIWKPGAVMTVLRSSGILHNRKLFLGIVVLTFHFIGFMIAMSMAPVTVVVPLMACTYIATTLLAKMVLHEKVTPMRWGGIAVIMIGVVLLGLSTLHPRPPRPGASRGVKKVVDLQRKLTTMPRR